MSTLCDRFAANLRAIRLERGFTQAALGCRAGLHRTEVSLLERGGREPRLSTILRLAGALGTDPERLCEGLSWRPGQPLPIRAGDAELLARRNLSS